MSEQGRLSVVGTGIRLGGQMTTEAGHLARSADRVFALADGLTFELLASLNPAIESLQSNYAVGKQRDASYAEMVERILAPLAEGAHVCAAFYGHPGIFVWPAHEVIRRARADGLQAIMYPGISAEDCLFADLGIDPAVHGCQSFEASDFLLHARRFDPTAALILWQPAALGDITRSSFTTDPAWVRALAEVLMADYPPDHPVIIYEAAAFPLDDVRRDEVSLECLHEAQFSQVSTLYLAPAGPPGLSPERLQMLGVSADDISFGAYQDYRNRD